MSRDVEVDAHVEGNLAAEVSMVALDTLELIVQVSHWFYLFINVVNNVEKNKTVLNFIICLLILFYIILLSVGNFKFSMFLNHTGVL